MQEFVPIIPVVNYPFPSLPFVLMYLLIANLILNYGLYEHTEMHSLLREAIWD